jgi:hypothetical protein
MRPTLYCKLTANMLCWGGGLSDLISRLSRVTLPPKTLLWHSIRRGVCSLLENLAELLCSIDVLATVISLKRPPKPNFALF